MKITQCPICGAELQATMEQYTRGTVLEADGSVLDWGRDCGVDGESRFYCENDHTQTEIVDALNAKREEARA